MNKKIILLVLLMVILLGGCQIGKDKLPSEMNPKDLPEGRAFEDEFTRGLLQSTEEVLPGYYPFLARNSRWEMAFPKEGLVNSLQYTSKDNYESILFSDSEEETGTSALVHVDFYSFYKPGDVESKKNSLRSNTGYPLEFEEISGDDQTYYIAPFEEKVDEGKFNLLYGYAAYIQKEDEAGGIFVRYTIYCEADCEKTKGSELKKAYDWIQTIQFVD